MARSRLMLFVPDVASAVGFYERAFQAVRDHVDEDGSYGEVDLGEMRIGFVADWHAETHLRVPFRRNEIGSTPAGFDLYIEVADVDAAFDRAKTAGALPLAEPERKPWGQRVAYVRDLSGVIVEMASSPEA